MLEARLSELRATALAAIAAANSTEDLERVRVDVLGRKGTLAQISKEMGKLAPERRGPIGKLLNAVKQEIESARMFFWSSPPKVLTPTGSPTGSSTTSASISSVIETSWKSTWVTSRRTG